MTLRSEDIYFDDLHDANDLKVTALLLASTNERKRLELENRMIFHFKATKPPGLNSSYNHNVRK